MVAGKTNCAELLNKLFQNYNVNVHTFLFYKK